MAPVRSFFPTLIHSASLGRGTGLLNRELASEILAIRARDAAGRAWSAANYPNGYTSYGSLDQLHRMSSTFIALRERIDRHVAGFARALHWDLRGQRLAMTDCWANVMERGSAHGSHIHPQAVVSGTYYVRTPGGASGLKFEDPRLPQMMAAPARRASAPEAVRPHMTLPARAGSLILFESWLRHEVPASRISAQRISVSFNYHAVSARA